MAGLNTATPTLTPITAHTHLIILNKERSRVAQMKQPHYCPAIGWLHEWKLLLLSLNPQEEEGFA